MKFVSDFHQSYKLLDSHKHNAAKQPHYYCPTFEISRVTGYSTDKTPKVLKLQCTYVAFHLCILCINTNS